MVELQLRLQNEFWKSLVQKFLSMKNFTRKNIGGLVIESSEKLDSDFQLIGEVKISK